ncbi:MAG: glutaredoxin family protein [Pseudohongiellaceae bacterium]
MNRLIFYTTAGCHLCEHAALLLDTLAAQGSIQFEVEQIDISMDEELVELYGIRIPVLKNATSSKEIGWPFTSEDITNLF